MELTFRVNHEENRVGEHENVHAKTRFRSVLAVCKCKRGPGWRLILSRIPPEQQAEDTLLEPSQPTLSLTEELQCGMDGFDAWYDGG